MLMATIMVVEDDDVLNDVLAYNLERAGYKVISAHDGVEAKTLLQERLPDLVLLDIMLPGADGWEICRWMDQTGRGVPVVFFTAKGSRDDFDAARRFRNFAGFFMKPYATSDVLRHVHKVLAGAKG
jgi:DNA-binding response OmpR family regulator